MLQVWDKRRRRFYKATYQNFVCRQSLRGHDALQRLKHQRQDFTAVTILLTADCRRGTTMVSKIDLHIIFIYIHLCIFCLWIKYIYKRKESSLGPHLAPQCWFSSQRSKHMQGSGHSVLNWWQCDWVKQEAKEETQRFLCPCDSDNPIRVLYVALQDGNHNLTSPPFWAATTTVLCHFITTWNTRVTHRTQ